MHSDRLSDNDSKISTSSSSPNSDASARARKHASTTEILAKLTLPRADGWTRFTTVYDAVGSFLGTGYWIGQAVDSCFSMDDFVLKLSIPALCVGLAVATFSSVCAGYIHYIVNLNHQNDALLEKKMTSEDAKRYRQILARLDDTEGNSINHEDALKRMKLDLAEALEILERYNIVPPENEDLITPRSLTFFQKVAVFGDAIAHIGDGAGTPTLLYNLAVNPSTLAIWINLPIQLLAIILGSINMKANIRTDVTNIHKYNKHHEETAHAQAEADLAYERMINRV